MDGRLGVGIVRLFVAAASGKNVLQVPRIATLGVPLVLDDLAVLRLVVDYDIPDFGREKGVVSFDSASGWRSSNPHLQVSGDASTLEVTGRLGVARFAPVTIVPAGRTLPVPFDPKGIVLETKATNVLGYPGVWLPRLDLGLVTDPVLGDPQSVTWTRFKYSPGPSKANEAGTYDLLELGFPAPNGKGRPRLLLGVWYPRVPLGDQPDVQVFFSPNTRAPAYPSDTYPYARAYPYRMRAKESSTRERGDVAQLAQPYADVARDYLCESYKIVPQMVAAGRASIIVMPVQPSGDWGPLLSRAGVWRMVLEVVRFGEATGLAGRGGAVARLSIQADGAKADVPDNAPLPRDPYQRDRIRLTTSGFSAGLAPMLALAAADSALDTGRYPHSHFGSSSSELDRAWRAIWDVDGAFQQLGGMESCVKVMTAWQARGGERTLRLYHSQDTHAGSADATTALRRLLPGISFERKPTKLGFIERGMSEDGRTSWLLFSNPMVRTPTAESIWPLKLAKDQVDLGDAHHMVPKLAFGHAFSLE